MVDMAKFKFRLQTFLNVKEQMEKSIKNELGIAVSKLELQKSILAKIQQDINNQEEDYRCEATKTVTLINLKNRIVYIKHLKEKEETQKHKVNVEQRNVDKIRERLVEVMKEKKVLEKLKEKEYEIYRKEQERIEQLLVDELVNYKEATKPSGDEI